MLPRRLRTVLLAAAGVTAMATAAGVAVVAHASSAGCSVRYTVGTQWTTGFTANVTVTNLGDRVSGWKVGWTYPAGQAVS